MKENVPIGDWNMHSMKSKTVSYQHFVNNIVWVVDEFLHGGD
jgi:hypothetical protein